MDIICRSFHAGLLPQDEESHDCHCRDNVSMRYGMPERFIPYPATKTNFIEVSVVSTHLWSPNPECPTIHIRNQSSLFSGTHTRFSSFTQIFRSGSNCKLSWLVIAKCWDWRMSMRDGETKFYWRRGLASPLGTIVTPSQPALVGCCHRDKISAQIFGSPGMCSIGWNILCKRFRSRQSFCHTR